MATNLIGVCQVCGRRLEFSVEHSGQSITCPHCGRTTRLKPAPPELIEAAPPEVIPPQPLAASETEPEPDATQRRLQRSYLKLAIVTVILVAILIGLVQVAEWLRNQAHQP
jgi:DNA-directed RNA polymerase subunit RPC12/RpoP